MVALKEMRICDLHVGDFGQYYFSPLYRGVAGLPDRAFFFFALGKIATKISTRLGSRRMIAICQAIIGQLNTPAKSSGPWKFSSGCR